MRKEERKGDRSVSPQQSPLLFTPFITVAFSVFVQELKSRPPQSSSSNANGDAAKSANKDKASKIKAQTSSHQPSAQASSKSNVPGPKQQEVSKSEEKSDSKKGKQKTRKRMVIEEVESEGKTTAQNSNVSDLWGTSGDDYVRCPHNNHLL